MRTTKVRRVGNALGVTLPKETVEALHVVEGDVLHLVETEGGVELTAYDPNFEAGVDAFEETRRRFRNTFRQLAKG